MKTFTVLVDLIRRAFACFVSWIRFGFAVVTVRRSFLSSFGRLDRLHAHPSGSGRSKASRAHRGTRFRAGRINIRHDHRSTLDLWIMALRIAARVPP